MPATTCWRAKRRRATTAITRKTTVQTRRKSTVTAQNQSRLTGMAAMKPATASLIGVVPPETSRVRTTIVRDVPANRTTSVGRLARGAEASEPNTRISAARQNAASRMPPRCRGTVAEVSVTACWPPVGGRSPGVRQSRLWNRTKDDGATRLCERPGAPPSTVGGQTSTQVAPRCGVDTPAR